MLNQISLMGRLTREPELKTTQGGRSRVNEQRHETCIQCGRDWNVSVMAKLFLGKWYICPQCEAKNRKVSYDGK